MDPVASELLLESGKESVRLLGRVLEPTADALGEALRRRLEPIIEQLGGRVRSHRDEVTNDLLLRSGEVLEARGRSPDLLRDAPPEVVAAAVLNATASLGGPDIRALFAGLIAGACERGRPGDIHPALPELIRQLDSPSARVLALLWTHGPISNQGPKAGVSWQRSDGRKIEHMTSHLAGAAMEGRGDVEQLSLAVPNLERLGLAREAKWRAGDRKPIGQGYSETNVREHSEIELTNLGRALCAACLGPDGA